MDEGEVAFGGQAMGIVGGVVHRVAFQQHPRAELGGLLDLNERGQLRHDDGRRDAEPRGVVGDALGVVAGGHRDHAARALLFRQARELDVGAAVLERRAVLEGLELERDVAPQQLREPLRAQARRTDDLARERLRRGFDVCEPDRHGAQGNRGA